MPSKLKLRWEPRFANLAVSFLKGTTKDTPFGYTEDGLVDLRELFVGEVLRPEKADHQLIDCSKMEAKSRLIFAKCILNECRFDGGRIIWGDFASTFRKVTFRKCKMPGSTFGAEGSIYEDCDFTEADLSGSTGLKPIFRRCVFDRTKWDDSVFRDCEFTDCKFAGPIRGVIFGGDFGTMNRCDFSAAVFVDCTFNRVKLSTCSTNPKSSLVFAEWPRALKAFSDILSRETDSEIIRSGKKWNDVWHDRLSVTFDNLISREDLEFHEGAEVGMKLFDLFGRIHDSRL